MRAAILGVGFMGWIHSLAYQRSSAANLVAFCSRDASKRAGDWRGIQGNFGPPGEQIDVSGMNVYDDLATMLRDPSIELVDICLPPHMHPAAIRQCLDAGKYVLCEKPLCLDAAQSRELAESARGRLMVAHILPFLPEYRYVCESASSGRLGAVTGGRFKRVIGPPTWIPDFYDEQTVGGPLVDLHVHDAHLIRMLFGMPSSVSVSRRRHDGDPSATPQYVDSLFHFDDPSLVVGAVSGVINQPSRGFTHGFDIQFEHANVQFEMAAFGDGTVATIPLVVAHADGTVERPELPVADAIGPFVDELDAAAAVVAGGPMPPALDAITAADAIEICIMQR